MSNKMIHTPAGVQDIYGRQLTRKNNIKKSLHQVISNYGYQDIETPTFEFSDVYSNDVGTTPEKEMYRFFDKEGSMLVLRPDFTPSIARSAAKYFTDEEIPARLCYEGNVFNNTSELQGKLKESTQMGAELIGMKDRGVADGELICLCIEALLNTGLKDFTVSVGNAMYFKGICDEAGLDEDIVYGLREYISKKNLFGASEYMAGAGVDEKYINGIIEVSKLTRFDELDKALELVDNERSKDAIKQLVELGQYVNEMGYGKFISLDLGMLSKFNYYTGIIFKAYTYGTGDAIVKGGRYDSLLAKFGKDASAVGLVFLVDDIMSACEFQHIPFSEEEKSVWIVYSDSRKSEALTCLKQYRDSGKMAIPVYMEPGKTKDYFNNVASSKGIDKVEYFI